MTLHEMSIISGSQHMNWVDRLKQTHMVSCTHWPTSSMGVYCMAVEMATVYSSVHAICFPMTWVMGNTYIYLTLASTTTVKWSFTKGSIMGDEQQQKQEQCGKKEQCVTIQ